MAGESLGAELGETLVRATSVGGARPKVLVFDTERNVDLIAKFLVASDVFPSVQAVTVAVAVELGRRVGLTVAVSQATQDAGRYPLLVDRFDRPTWGGRRLMVSALTLLGLREMIAPRASSYATLPDLMLQDVPDGIEARTDLFRRIVFNVAVGNTDDHLRNHAAVWDGASLKLTPVYDIAPQIRSGNDVNQTMNISRSGDGRSRFSTCIAAAGEYGLLPAEAREIVDRVKQVVNDEWQDAADATQLSSAEREQLWHRAILNPSIEWDRQLSDPSSAGSVRMIFSSLIVASGSASRDNPGMTYPEPMVAKASGAFGWRNLVSCPGTDSGDLRRRCAHRLRAP